MFEKIELVQIARALATHSGQRLSIITQNTANADTPGYRAKDIAPFPRFLDALSPELRASRPGHFRQGAAIPAFDVVAAPGPMAPNGNSVDLDLQMVNAAEARQAHEMALAIYRNSSAIVRASLGRNT